MAHYPELGAALSAPKMAPLPDVNSSVAAAQDLGPLAWVLEDLRASLTSAGKAVRRFVWDEKTGAVAHRSQADTSELDQARKKFHQSAGALEMVGQQPVAMVLRSLEALAHKFVQWPDMCTDDAARRVERASRAVVDYVEGILKGSQTSPVALFPQQRAVMELCGAERIHPADLWQRQWHWLAVELPGPLEPLHYSPTLRARLGEALLPILKTLDTAHAAQMAHLCAGLAAGESSLQARSYWAMAGGFFEAIALACLPDDVYVRRSAAKIMAQYALMATGQAASLEAAVQDLMFFCALANPPPEANAPLLQAVRSAYGLDGHQGIDYEASPFGRFDPAQLSLVRKHIAGAAESWSALAGGDLGHFGAVAEQFAQVAQGVAKLHPDNLALVAALGAAAQATARTGATPNPAVAMEVATALLYLEAVFADLDFASPAMEQRSARLAARLQQACTGGAPEPIESWMEELYRRVSHRKTMGSVVAELRLSLAEIEKSLDSYVRNPADTGVLQAIPAGLGQMRGVFSVLGLDQAALAALRMRANVELLLAPGAAPLRSSSALFSQLVSSLSAMGLLIDMLAYQPVLAKDLFVFDEALGEFKPRMGRESSLAQGAHRSDTQTIEADAQEAPWALLPKVPDESALGMSGALALDDDDDGGDGEIRAIFLAEAREVLQDGMQAVDALALAPNNGAALATLRRAFHTLKGSARMVDLHDVGEAAWAFEQLLNASLAEQQPASDALVALCKDAVQALGQWIEALTLDQTPPLGVHAFRRCADSLRLLNQYESLSGASLQSELGALGMLQAPEDEPVAAQTQAPPDPSIYQSAAGSSAAVQAPAQPEVVVGHLRLSADFFEVFLEEAQSWAQRLQTELAQWDVPSGQTVPHGAAALAHSLQGSAAAVGFNGLWALARALEQALDHLALHGLCSDAYKSVLCDAAHETTRLLAGFSIGSLVEPSPAILQSLANLVHARSLLVQGDVSQEGESSADRAALATVERVNLPSAPSAPQGPPGLDASVALALPGTEPLAPSGLAAPPARASDWSPDIEAQDALDAELLPIFLEEGAELLSLLGSSLRHWAQAPDQPQFRAQVLRVLHTFKGSARLAGGLRLGELAHRMESTVEALDLAFAPLSAALEPCLQEFEQLKAHFDALAGLPVLGEPEAHAPEQYSAQLSAGPAPVPSASKAPAISLATASPSRASSKQLVRVRAQTLDRLIDQAGEVMISRARADGHVTQMRSALGDLGRSLERLRQQLRDMELQLELQMQSGLTQPQDAGAAFDPLELDRFTRVQEVARMMAESVNDVETMQHSLQSSVDGALEDLFLQGRRAKQITHDLLRMRLLEFESLSDRLYAVVRQAAKGAGKQVRLDIVGGSIEIDRGVLERMTPAFEHLLRNAVAHGIEPAAVRLAAGKPAVGALSISVQQDGSDVSVTFSDDGGGLQIDKITALAQASGLLAPDQALSLDEAAQLLFVPGFSTADEVTELAGRGIGLDVVLSEVSAIGGRIETHSQPGVGTGFKVVFPLTTAVTQVVMLRMGTLTIGVPANLLETVLRLPRATLDQAYASASLADGDRPAVPFFWGGALLKASTRSYGHKTTMRQHAVAVIRSAGQRVALHVDEVLGSREVVVKNLGPQLSRLPGLVGMSVLASGAVVLIYNPVALASLYGDAARRVQATAMSLDADGGAGLDASGSYAAPPALAPLILVVDDSITVRRVTQRLLHREGYRVALAGDGLQALELLQDERPAVVLSDIEMPRMDGMELTRQIRQDPAFADLPIIVITSRIAQKHRDYAAALGVNDYLGKPYAESELLSLIRTHCTAAALA